MTKERIDPALEKDLLIKAYHYHRYELADKYIINTSSIALDVGSGTGFGAPLLKCNQLVELDRSERAIRYALKYYDLNKNIYIVGDAQQLPFRNGIFDYVISLEVIEHLRDQKTFLAEIRRVLKPNGLLILSTPNVCRPTRNPFHTRELSYPELLRLLANEQFSIIKALGIVPKGFWLFQLLIRTCARISSAAAWRLARFFVTISERRPELSFYIFIVSRPNAGR